MKLPPCSTNGTRHIKCCIILYVVPHPLYECHEWGNIRKLFLTGVRYWFYATTIIRPGICTRKKKKHEWRDLKRIGRKCSIKIKRYTQA